MGLSSFFTRDFKKLGGEIVGTLKYSSGDQDFTAQLTELIAKKPDIVFMLEIRNLHVRYGGIQAVQGISLNIPRGSIVTLIGANGAGKSSIIRSIAGLNKTISGDILLTRHEGDAPVSLMTLLP